MFRNIVTYMCWNHGLNTVRIQMYLRINNHKKEKRVEFMDGVHSAGEKIHFETLMITGINILPTYL